MPLHRVVDRAEHVLRIHDRAELADLGGADQPGVEAGKKAAARVLELQRALVASIEKDATVALAPAEWAARAGYPGLADEAYWVLAHLAANGRGIARVAGDGVTPTYGAAR